MIKNWESLNEEEINKIIAGFSSDFACYSEFIELAKLVAEKLREKNAHLLEPEFMPIDENTPRDGRKVILYRPLAHLSNDPHVTIKKTQKNPNWVFPQTIPKGCDGKNYNDGLCYATLWFPIPKIPTNQKG